MLYAFDLDCTLTQKETLPYLAKRLDLLEEYDKICANINNMSYEDGLIERLQLFKHEESMIVSIFIGVIPVYAGLRRFIVENRDKCCIITSNIDYYVKKLTKQFHCRVYASSWQEFKAEKRIINKAETVGKLKQKDKVCYIGDGLNDVEAMKLADFSIAAAYAHDAPTAVKEAASVAAYTEAEALAFLQGVS